MTTPDRIHLASGSTVGNAKLNIGDANGFGLEWIFRGQCRYTDYKGNVALLIQGPFTGYREKVVVFAGGASQARIRGNSFGMWIATEINLHKDEMIKESFNRTLASRNRKIFWDLNPTQPRDHIYTDYIDLYRDKAAKNELVGGLNYRTFTIFDNINISKERCDEIISQYDPNSIWYTRDILGKRVVADGVFFRQFSSNPDKWILKELPKDLRWMTFGIDFGVNHSKTVFICTGIRANGAGVVILEEYQRDCTGVSPDAIENDFVRFAKMCIEKYKNLKATYCWTDQPETLTHGIAAACRRANVQVKVMVARKEQIITRIYSKERMLNTGKWHVMDNCPLVVYSTRNQVWDDKHPGKDIRLDNDPDVNDVADAEEYSWEPFIDEMGVRA